MAKRKQTETEKLYNKELKRINKFIKRAQARGFMFDRLAIVPQRPKRVTKSSVSKLQRIKPDFLYSKSTYYDPTSDTFITGTARREQERKTAARKASETRRAREYAKSHKTAPIPSKLSRPYDIIWNEINSWQPLPNWKQWKATQKENDKNLLRTLMRTAEHNFGKDVISQRLENHAEEAIELARTICYDSETFFGGGIPFQRIAEILTGGPMTSAEAMKYSTDQYPDEEY